jgi:hypothetical protein
MASKEEMTQKVASTLNLEVEDLAGESILQIALTYNQIIYNEALQQEQKRRQKQAAVQGALFDPFAKKRS